MLIVKADFKPDKENAPNPTVLTEEGSVTLVSLEQPEKAYSSILVTLEGIVTVVIVVLSSNADSPIVFTVLGIDTDLLLPVYEVKTPLLTVKSEAALAVIPVLSTGSATVKIRDRVISDEIIFFVIFLILSFMVDYTY